MVDSDEKAKRTHLPDAGGQRLEWILWPPESTTKFVMQAEIVWQMLGSLSGSPMQIGGPDNEQSYLLQQSSQPSRR